jgi:mono/diheme cytochrome c family protein
MSKGTIMKLARRIRIGSNVIASSAAVLAIFMASGEPAAAETLLERGSYLVNAVMACDSCHTPRQPGGAFVMEKRFSGGSQTWDEPAFVVKGANITPDLDTGIGRWSEDDLKRALTEGGRPAHAPLGGVPLAPQMPFNFYKILLPRDLEAVVAYVRSVAPIYNEVQPPTYKAPTVVNLVPGAERPIEETALHDPVKRGFYLATIAHCMECHARRPDGVYDFKNWLGKGGREMTGPFGAVTVRNITSHPTAGIGAWTDDEIKRALTQGVSRDGRGFKPPMARHFFYSHMMQDDLDALVVYLRTLPPLE